MSLSECSDSYFSVNINLGERRESDNLQVFQHTIKKFVFNSKILFFQFHNNIVKYVLQSFSTVTVHLEGEVYQVCKYRVSSFQRLFLGASYRDFYSTIRDHSSITLSIFDSFQTPTPINYMVIIFWLTPLTIKMDNIILEQFLN